MAVLRRLTMVMAAILMFACSHTSVTTRFNPTTPFGRYHTYGWLPLLDQGRTADRLRGSAAEQRIKAAVYEALSAKGIVPALSNQVPDFLITYHLRVRERSAGSGLPAAAEPGWAGGLPPAYNQATLLIDFIEPRTGQVFWRGLASGLIDSPDPDNDRIRQSIAKMVREFPPSAKQVAAAKQHAL
jgi:hypothetical protein